MAGTFYGSHVPDMFIAQSGTVTCAFLHVERTVEAASEHYPYT